MPTYKELEHRDWELIKRDPVLRSAVDGVLAAGKMLHKGYHKIGLTDAQHYRTLAERLMAEPIGRKNPDDLFIGKTANQGADHTKGTVWLGNGIDGIVNFRNGIPLCDVAVAQTENGVPIRAAAYDFLHGKLYYAAGGEGSYVNGRLLQVPDPEMSSETVISFASLFARDDHKSEDERLVSAVRELRKSLEDQYHVVPREHQAGILELCWIAEGRAQGYASSWTTRNNLGPGVLAVIEAGGFATHVDGSLYIPDNQGVMAGTPRVYEVMSKTIVI